MSEVFWEKKDQILSFDFFFICCSLSILSWILKNLNIKLQIFFKSNIPYTFPGIMWGPTKSLGPIGSAVLKFIGFKQNRQAKYMLSVHLGEHCSLVTPRKCHITTNRQTKSISVHNICLKKHFILENLPQIGVLLLPLNF